MASGGYRRKVISLIALAILAAIAWVTMDASKMRILVLIILGGIAVRISLTGDRPRYDRTEPPK